MTARTVEFLRECHGYAIRLDCGVTLALGLKNHSGVGLWYASIDARQFKEDIGVSFEPDRISVERSDRGHSAILWMGGCSIRLTDAEADELARVISEARAAIGAAT